MPRRSNRTAQGLAAFFQSPLQRAERPAELLGRFIAGQTGQVAQQEGRTQPFRQALQFLVESLANLLPDQTGFAGSRLLGSGGGSRSRRPAACATLAAIRQVVLCSQCGKRLPLADRFRQPGQTEKDGLEDILGIVGLSTNRRAVPSTIGPWRAISSSKASRSFASTNCRKR